MMTSKQAGTKKNTFFRLFCLSFAIHLLLPFLVFISNFSSFDWQLFVSSYFSPLWVVVLMWLLLLIIITTDCSVISRFKTYLKKHRSALMIFFIGIFVVSWYLLPGVHNFINSSVLGQTGNALWDHLSTQVPQIISILFWELIVFGVLYILIYVGAKCPNAVRLRQNLWSIVIFPFKELGTKGKAIISILAVLFVIFAFVLSSPHFPGAGTVYLAGVAAVVGLIFTWSASAAIADFISGIILIFLTNLEKGDWVKIGDVTGKIKEQNLLVHQIETTKNSIVTIPNANVLRNMITNYTPSKKRTKVDRPQCIYTTVTLGYDVDQKSAIDVLERAARSTEDIITTENVGKLKKQFQEEYSKQKTLREEDSKEIEDLYNKIIDGQIDVKPFVNITSLDDCYVSYELNAYLNPSVSHLYPETIQKIYSKLHENIQNECLNAMIEIFSPHYEVTRYGNIPAVPEEHLYIPKFTKFQRVEQGKDTLN